MGSPVSLIKTENCSLKKCIAKSVQILDQTSSSHDKSKAVRNIIIKPNLNYYWKSSTGCTTDPKVVEALIDYLREEYGNNLSIKVAEADASAMRTKYAFKMLGYEKLAKEKQVELFNLSHDTLKTESVTIKKHKIELQIPQSLKEADLFINVPKLKIARVTTITCAMKNLFGCIATPRKFAYHPILEETIVGINKILKPSLTIVDGLVGLGRFPFKMDLVMAGRDAFSIDWVVAQIAGYNPRKIGFIKLAIDEKLGSTKGIVTIGENLDKIRNSFPKEGRFPRKFAWNLQFKMLRVYSRISGDVIPPFLENT